MSRFAIYNVHGTTIDTPSICQGTIIKSDSGYIQELLYEEKEKHHEKVKHSYYFADLGNWYLAEAGYNTDRKAWINLTYRIDETGMHCFSIITDVYLGSSFADIVLSIIAESFELEYDLIPYFIQWLKIAASPDKKNTITTSKEEAEM